MKKTAKYLLIAITAAMLIGNTQVNVNAEEMNSEINRVLESAEESESGETMSNDQTSEADETTSNDQEGAAETETEEEDAEKSGFWTDQDGKVYYYKDGLLYKGELKYEGNWYYFDKDGVMATGWTEHHGKTYYYDSEGRMQYGIQEIDGKRYYFHMIYGTKETGEAKYNGNWYYFDEAGVMATGWTEHHGKTYYYDSEGRMQYGIQEIDGKHYYFHVIYGNKVIGEAKYNGNWYYLDEAGVMATGWTEHHGKTYYYDSEGRMQYGIQEIDGKCYYFHMIYGNKVTGEAKYNGNWYYFNEAGVMATGWTEHHGKTYYYDSEGRMQYGIQEIEGKKYYFHPVYGTKQTEAEAKVNDNWYYFDKAGVMVTGWAKHHDHTYYYDENGCMQYGLQEIEGKKYYFDPVRGIMVTGSIVLDGKLHYFEKDGRLATKAQWIWFDGYKRYITEEGVASEDVSALVNGPYRITVYKSLNYAIVYAKDENGNYNIPVKAMIASCGNNTPTGTFATTSFKQEWLCMVDDSWGQWCTQIIGDYLFHSVPYKSRNEKSLFVDKYNYLGTTKSLGCIRLQASEAKWIYDRWSSVNRVYITTSKVYGPLAKPVIEKIPDWHTWDPTDPKTQALCKEKGCH